MFNITGSGADPLRIIGCQSEGATGNFLVYSGGTNDQAIIHLDRNVINQPVEVTGFGRVTSTGNYINSTVTLTGFVRWKSENDVWDGVFGSPIHAPQAIVNSPAQFSAKGLKNAVSYNGHYLPNNFRIENGEATAGGWEGVVVTRAGIRCITFFPTADLVAGQYIQPTTPNDHAYLVTVGGTTGTEPTWPTGSGTTITSGSVTFQEIGVNAILKNYGAIAA